MAVLRISNAARNAALNAVTALLDAGAGPATIEIRSGPMPNSPDEAPGGGALLATLTFSDPAFGSAANGSASAGPITEDSEADATGTASWARLKDSNGNAVLDCDVTATGGGGTIQLNTVNLVQGGPVRITAFTLTMPAG